MVLPCPLRFPIVAEITQLSRGLRGLIGPPPTQTWYCLPPSHTYSKRLELPVGTRHQELRSPQPHFEDSTTYRALRPTRLGLVIFGPPTEKFAIRYAQTHCKGLELSIRVTLSGITGYLATSRRRFHYRPLRPAPTRGGRRECLTLPRPVPIRNSTGYPSNFLNRRYQSTYAFCL